MLEHGHFFDPIHEVMSDTRKILKSLCKVKCTLAEALRLCTGRTAHTRSRRIALPFLDHGTRRGWGVSVTPRPIFTPGKDPLPIVQEAVWAPEQVWTAAENLAPTGIRSPDRPARSQLLYRLSYPAHKGLCTVWIILKDLMAVILKKKNSVALVRERTIPTERPPPVGEVTANGSNIRYPN